MSNPQVLKKLADEIESAVGMTIRSRNAMGRVDSQGVMAAHREAIVTALRTIIQTQQPVAWIYEYWSNTIGAWVEKCSRIEPERDEWHRHIVPLYALNQQIGKES